MKITVNAVELATYLADAKMGDIFQEDYEDVIEQNEDDEPVYTEKGQTMFDGYYDDFLEMILDCQIDTNEVTVMGNNNIIIQ